MNIVDKLIEYRNTRNADIFGSIESDNLIVMVTELLSWLKLERKREIWIEQGRKTKLKPLKLNMNYPWCNDLVTILQADSLLAEVFCVEDKSVTFKDSVSSEYIHEARLRAYDNYNPEMIIN